MKSKSWESLLQSPCMTAAPNPLEKKIVRVIFFTRHTKTHCAVSIRLKVVDINPITRIQENTIMSLNGQINGRMPLFLIAGLACLFCVPVIYLATRPVIWLLHAQWIAWLLMGLFVLVPLSVTFIILYRSGWHEERPTFRRILSTAFSSCLIFGVDLLAVGALIAAACLIAGLARVMGGN